MGGFRRVRRGARGRWRDRPPRHGRAPLRSLIGQRPVDRFNAHLFTRGIHALPEHAHREQAATGRRGRSSQPSGNTEEYATVHTPRLTRGMLSACKGAFKQFIHEKFIYARPLSCHW
jgi:hypothetical protein